MNGTRTDWLLRSTRVLLYIAMGAVVIGTVALLVAIPAMWVFSDKIIIEAAKHDVSFMGTQTIAGISAILVIVLVILGVAFQFIRKLKAIVDSVGQGSPFIPENAARLRYMGWLVVGTQAFLLACVPLAVWLSRVLPKDDEVRVVFSLDFSWIITALLLFILARVFEHGTQLEEDVEGTV